LSALKLLQFPAGMTDLDAAAALEDALRSNNCVKVKGVGWVKRGVVGQVADDLPFFSLNGIERLKKHEPPQVVF
jgi:hypothetical protein